MTLTLLAPLQGWIAPLEEVPDAVFAERMLGDGVAIDPTGSTVHAPCDGEVTSVARTGHAVTLRADAGAEILIHIGLETVTLAGEGFTAHVAPGRRVKAGELLITFDLDLLMQRAKSLLTPILITNAAAFRIAWRDQDREAAVGDRLMGLEAVNAAALDAAEGVERRRSIVLGLPHGLHARPAGRVVALAKPFAAEVTILVGERRANARSPVALMTLGAAQGAALTLAAHGSDADAVLDALAAFLTGDGGEGAATPRPTSAPVAMPRASAIDGVIKGVRAAPGYAVGRAVQLRRVDIHVAEEGAGPAVERARLADALKFVREQMRSAMAIGTGAEIVEAQLALLDDPDLHAAAEGMIVGGKSGGYAWGRALDDQATTLRALDDPRLRERAADLIDLKRQVLLALGGEADMAQPLPANAILLADDLLPSELMAHEGCVLGVCTAAGGPTSHVAIIAAALNIPAVVAAGVGVLGIEDNTPVIFDADAGTLRVNPNTDELALAHTAVHRRAAARAVAVTEAGALCHMADGTRIEVFANLAGVSEAAAAVANGAEGCGLLRSEFLFMDRPTPPDEDEQRAAYQTIADTLGGRPLIIRTLDIGGDKPTAYLPMPREDNPALGLRGVRTSLWRPDLLRTQLRAILRVSPPDAVKILVPMVTSVQELAAVRAILDEARRALGLTAPVDLGVMIETPAAAVTTGLLAETADFFSIGTNDLTQYALAMDRTNAAMAAQVDALHPAILRLIALACDGAAAGNRPVAVCGALASEPQAAPLLVGLGVTELSAAPGAIPAVKGMLRLATLQDCQSLAALALAKTSAAEVRALLADFARAHPEITP